MAHGLFPCMCIVFFQSKLYWFESKYNCILLKLLKLASGTTFNNLYNWLQYSCSKLSFLKNPHYLRTLFNIPIFSVKTCSDVKRGCPPFQVFAVESQSWEQATFSVAKLGMRWWTSISSLGAIENFLSGLPYCRWWQHYLLLHVAYLSRKIFFFV